MVTSLCSPEPVTEMYTEEGRLSLTEPLVSVKDDDHSLNNDHLITMEES